MDDKILLVDDEKDIVDLLEEMLQKEGFHSIQKSYTGMSALNTCRDFQPDVIVLDIMLPDIDGLEVCKKIREFPIAPSCFCLQKMMILIKSSVCLAEAMITLQNRLAHVK